MKKIILYLLSMFFVLVSCNSKKAPENENEAPVTIEKYWVEGFKEEVHSNYNGKAITHIRLFLRNENYTYNPMFRSKELDYDHFFCNSNLLRTLSTGDTIAIDAAHFTHKKIFQAATIIHANPDFVPVHYDIEEIERGYGNKVEVVRINGYIIKIPYGGSMSIIRYNSDNEPEKSKFFIGDANHWEKVNKYWRVKQERPGFFKPVAPLASVDTIFVKTVKESSSDNEKVFLFSDGEERKVLLSKIENHAWRDVKKSSKIRRVMSNAGHLSYSPLMEN